jgi:hypothetical protein
MTKFLNFLNTVLVINTFVVLGSFAWFVIALLGRSTGLPLGFGLWYKLWNPVFTPSIGLLMGGAILSGILNQVSKRLPQRVKSN